MRSIRARDILMIDTISKGNDKPWDKLAKYMQDNNIDEDVEFDFEGIEVVQPGSSMSFNKIINNPHFHMVLHSSNSTTNTIKAICVLNNLPIDKVRNIEVVTPKKISVEERNINTMVGQLSPYLRIENNIGIFETYRRFDQIGQPMTLKYIEVTIMRHSEQTGCKNYFVDFGGVSIQTSIINVISDCAERLEKAGIKVEFHSNDKETQDKIDMKMDIGTSSYTMAERYNIMKARLIPGRVGILTKYREGRAKDEFGRIGRGEKVSVRIAVFKGFSKDKDGNILASFDSYNSNYFYTKDHWYLENDGEELEDLVYERINIKIDDLGIYNDFIGSRYHFSSAIQFSKNGSVIMYHLEPVTDTKSSVVGVEYTIPERIKAVFDDFGVEYDRESLEGYIKKTREILDSKKDI